MIFSAVIFDLDGTLANTLEDIADNMNSVLVEKGFPVHSYGDYCFFVGNGLKNLVARSLPESERTDEMIDSCYARMLEEYSKNYINKTRLYDGIPELLDILSDRDVKMAVLSNKDNVLTQKICSELLCGWKFAAVLGADARFQRKPNPESALYLAEHIGVAPADISYLGDSDVDMKTAVAAGFYPVGAGWGFRPKQELLENGAKIVIEHPLELIKLLK